MVIIQSQVGKTEKSLATQLGSRPYEPTVILVTMEVDGKPVFTSTCLGVDLAVETYANSFIFLMSRGFKRESIRAKGEMFIANEWRPFMITRGNKEWTLGELAKQES